MDLFAPLPACGGCDRVLPCAAGGTRAALSGANYGSVFGDRPYKCLLYLNIIIWNKCKCLNIFFFIFSIEIWTWYVYNIAP